MRSHSSIILGITGGIACGKTETGRILAEAGFDVLDTDSLAHDVMKAGTSTFKQVVKQFGKSILNPDGEMDRTQLGRLVFADSSAREALNRLVHPAVIKAAEQWKAERKRESAILVPLLFEAGWTEGWDAVVCVSADEDVVFQRLEKRGLNREEARQRIAAQMPRAEKETKSDFIIRNNKTLDALRKETLNVLERIRSRGNSHE
jgi:dephospho-CoA kinase